MRSKWIWMLIPLALALAGCADSIAPDDEGGNDDEIDRVETTDNGDGTFSTVFDTSEQAAEDWIYFLFSTGEDVERSDWDFSLHFANFNLNGGDHGSGGVELQYFDDDGFDALEQAPGGVYITDVGDDDAGRAFNQGTGEYNGGWYHYNGQTHQMTINPDRYYVIHTVAGDYVKFRVTDFVWNFADQVGYVGTDWAWLTAP